MKKIACSHRTLVSALIVVGGLSFATPASAASRDTEALKRSLGTGVRVAEHGETGKVRFVGTAAGKPIARARGLSRSASPSRVARAFFESYGAAFGIRDQARELRVTGTEAGIAGRSAVRFQQLYEDVPVLGGELVVNLDAARNILSASGEVLPDSKVTTSPQVGTAAAREAAIVAVAKAHRVPAVRLDSTFPELWIYDSRILGGPGLERPTLVWRLEVNDGAGLPIDELVLVDAERGNIALTISQIEHLKSRRVCDAANTSAQYPCDLPAARIEGGPVHPTAEVNQAYDFSGHTYDFFFSRFGRDSVDGQGKTMTSTVRHCDPACTPPNAFWDGEQAVYGPNVAAADDVVGHELAHGVTEFSAHLFYYYQSGAINESLSDVFGEFIDQTNLVGDDSAGAKWLLGEDVAGSPEFRNMANPPALGDPDRMTSPNYTADLNEDDGGGVHTNSGVNNKAAFLMTDGATFNGRVVTGLGITKVARIYYTVLTSMLTSASDYADLGNALQQACTNLVGTDGITTSDCTEVADAVAAVEMSVSPPAAPTTPDAPVCPSGLVATDLFSDDIENASSGKWTATNPWFYPGNPNNVPFVFDAEFATSGTNNIWGYNKPTVGDYSITMNSGVAIPAGSTAYLRFNHSYGFEDDAGGAYDGGMLEVSVNGGAFADAGSLLTESGYNGTLTTISNNPLEGRPAFVRESNGYGSSRAALSSLAGQNVRFRFRIGTDGSFDDYGWFIDDVRLYTCAAPPPPPPPPVVVAPPVVVPPVVTLSNASVKSCRRTGRARRTRVLCTLTGFGAVSRATLKVTRRGRTVASGSAKPSSAGRLTIKGRRTLGRGTYRVTLTLRDASGKTRKLTKTMRVR